MSDWVKDRGSFLRYRGMDHIMPSTPVADLRAGPFPLSLLRMSTTEILAQLSRLSAAERDAVRSRLDAIDSAAPATPEEKRLIEERVASYRANPDRTVSWGVAEQDIRKQTGL